MASGWTGGDAFAWDDEPPVGALVEDLFVTVPWLAGPQPGRLRVLEAAGNGEGATVFLPLGHTVIILNADQDVLDAARERLLADPDRLAGTVALARGTVADVATRWGSGSFDVVLCHTVFERSIDPQAVLRTLGGALKPGGYLSLAFADRQAVGAAALNDGGDGNSGLEEGNGRLRAQNADTSLTPDVVLRWLKDAGLSAVSRRTVDAAKLPSHERGGPPAGGVESPVRYWHVVVRKPLVFPVPL